jgi:hypothetical protein
VNCSASLRGIDPGHTLEYTRSEEEKSDEKKTAQKMKTRDDYVILGDGEESVALAPESTSPPLTDLAI